MKPISGDLLKENLDLSKEDEEDLIENLHVIINCAASIDFNARLEDAIKINILGSLRVLSLAKKIKNLQNFLHVSTSYVNCNKFGYIEEKIYNDNENEDSELILAKLIEMEKNEVPIIFFVPFVLLKFFK